MGPLDGPRVWIVIVNWNGLADTLECLGSVHRLRYPNAQVVVVDNGSRQNDADQIREAFPQVVLIRHAANRGFTGGCNAGIEFACRNGAEYIWLLNNDTTVEPGCLTELVAAGEADGGVGLLSPVIYDYTAPRAMQFCGTFVDGANDRKVSPTCLEVARNRAEGDTLLLWGTALLIKRAVVDAIGYLDDRYFAYHEDFDYSLRAKAAGFGARVVPGGAVFHKASWEAGAQDSPVREYLFVRNWYLLWRSHAQTWRRYAHWRQFAAWAMDRALGAKAAGKVVVAEHALDGMWDALQGRWGSWETKGEMPKVLKRFVLGGLFGWHPYGWMTLLAEGPLETVRKGWCRCRRRP